MVGLVPEWEDKNMSFWGKLFKKRKDTKKYGDIFYQGENDEWAFVYETKDVTLYYIPSSVTIDIKNNLLKVWVTNDFTNEGEFNLLKLLDKIDNQKYNDVSYENDLILFNYIEWKYNLFQQKYYSTKDDLLLSLENPQWADIVIDSLIYTLLITLIRDFNIQLNGYNDDWVYLNGDEYITQYYNSSSINLDKQNKLIRFLVKNVFTDKGKIDLLKDFNSEDKQTYIDFGYNLGLTLLDYNHYKYMLIYLIDYSISNNILRDYKYPSIWRDIVNNSNFDIFLNRLLKVYNIKR
jgi:hypothetical protein